MARLPPMTTLPVLEASARLGSFSLAAEELHVTHGAVSHQIRSLEEFLGMKLFVRSGRGVALTVEGELLAGATREALEKIEETIESLKPAARENTLVISVLPSFASRWLMPRLGNFLESHPTMQISVLAVQQLANFRIDGVDVAIRYGVGPWPGLHSTRLAGDSYIAVCSPKFRRGRLPKRPEQMVDLPLFCSEPGMWSKWFALAGMDFAPPSQAIEYNDAALFLQQAVAREGIVLTRRSIAASDLAEGRLVRLFDYQLPSDRSYHLVCLPQCVNWPKIAAFRTWIVNQIDWD